MSNLEEKDIEQLTEDVLMDLGISPCNKGFSYIVMAIPYFHERKSMRRVYFDLAEFNNDTISRVERAIRHSFETGNKEKMDRYFGCVRRNNESLLSVLNIKIRRLIEK